ncbi:hypothetical protein [Bradyrhizobium sp.]|uniref:hypothetical protein n=1 Tax=Bradyrhizobium sp. TaxID=376 RepID=UPI003C3DADF2
MTAILRSRKDGKAPFLTEWPATGEVDEVERTGTMGLFVLEIVVWGLGVRGRMPQFEHSGPRRNRRSPLSRNAVARLAAGFLVSVACLALALWLAVWLAIRLL